MTDYPVIDAHIHLWDLAHLRYPWLDNVPIINRTYLLNDYDQARGQQEVEAMVFVQGECLPEQHLEELSWAQSLADREPRLKAIVPWAPLEKGDDVYPVLDRMRRDPRVKGIRRIIQFEEDMNFCIAPGFVRGVRLLGSLGLHFEITISPAHFPNVMKLAEACPETVFILDHLGNPDIAKGGMRLWRDHMKAFAGSGPHFCKFSNMVCNADLDAWSIDDLRPFADVVIETFGPDRLIWASDWPHVLRASGWKRWFETAEALTTSLGDKNQRKIFYNNAASFYRLGS